MGKTGSAFHFLVMERSVGEIGRGRERMSLAMIKGDKGRLTVEQET